MKLEGISKLFVELIVVFAGVFSAFYLNSLNEKAKINAQSDRILSSLRIELEQMRIFFPEQSNYMSSKIKEWRTVEESGKWTDFYNWRYIQPQYNYAILEYAIDERETDIINFELHEALLQLYREIRKLEAAENYVTDLAFEYQAGVVGSNDPADKLAIAQNKYLFSRFISFCDDRGDILKRAASLSSKTLELINAKFTQEELMEQTTDLIQHFIENANMKMDKEYVRELLSGHFGHFSEAEKDEILANLNFPEE